MTEILIDGIDAETPACAAEILGTRTAEDTVDAALRRPCADREVSTPSP